MIVDIELKGGERIRMPGSPMNFPHSAPPRFRTLLVLGGQTDAVLRDMLAYGLDRIEALRAECAKA